MILTGNWVEFGKNTADSVFINHITDIYSILLISLTQAISYNTITIKNYRVRNAKKKNYIIRLGKVYDMVADSLAVTTKDRSDKRIVEALLCCLTALKADGHWFERPVGKAAVRSIKKRLDKLPIIQ
jgi:hypothetical protein